MDRKAQRNIVIIWDGDPAASGGGVLREGNVIVAGPGERVRLDSATAEQYVREGKAHFPKN